MNKKLVWLSVLSVFGIVFFGALSFVLQIKRNDVWYIFLSVTIGGLPIVLLLREIEKVFKPKSLFLRFVLKWPQFIWVIGTVLSAFATIVLALN